jgi:organic hydroperoxide reductase OsmC/OhrA
VAADKTHEYRLILRWTGNRGTGTSGYRDYSRDHEMTAPGKASVLSGSSDPSFRGDRSRYNPEELLVASLSSCHMLWALHFCADAGITVVDYRDEPEGQMLEQADGAGQFVRVTLHPAIVLAPASAARAAELDAIHHRAHECCFVARSVNFPVEVKPAPVTTQPVSGTESSAYSGTEQ